MPAARHFSRSPTMALAVMAIIQVRSPFLFPPADFSGGFVAIQIRHLAIHEDDVVLFLFECIKHFDAVVDDIGVVAKLVQIAQGNLLIPGYPRPAEYAPSERQGCQRPTKGSCC